MITLNKMHRADLCETIRQRLKRYPAPYDAHYGVVPPPPPESVSQHAVAQEVAAALRALTRLDTLTRALPHGYIATRVLLRREAVTSSTIEGTQSTLDELLSAEEQGGAGARADVKRVHRYALALERALGLVRDRGAAALDVAFIQSLHQDLMAGDPAYADEPGAFRSTVVWIGGVGMDIAYSTYNPAPPADIPACMEEHVSYLRGDGMQQFLPVPVRLAVAHAHFEAVHPFRDGNGRVGRLLLPLLLAAEGHQPLYTAAYIEAHRDAYYGALKDAQQRLDYGPIIRYLAGAMTASVQEVEVTREALAQLPERWRARQALRAGSTASRAVELLADWPVLTVGRLAGLLGVTYQAANQAIERLLSLRVLVERTGYQRNRVFVAEDVLRVINRPFGAAPVLP